MMWSIRWRVYYFFRRGVLVEEKGRVGSSRMVSESKECRKGVESGRSGRVEGVEKREMLEKKGGGEERTDWRERANKRRGRGFSLCTVCHPLLGRCTSGCCPSKPAGMRDAPCAWATRTPNRLPF